MRTGVAIRRVRRDASAARGNLVACEEIDAWRTKAAVNDVRRNDLIAMSREYAGHRTITTTGFPDRAAELDVLQQRVGDPIWGGIIIPSLPVIAGVMDSAVPRRLR